MRGEGYRMEAIMLIRCLLLLLCVSRCMASSYFVCTGPGGQPVYSDRPCEANARSQPLPTVQRTGSSSLLRGGGGRQWTERVACENRVREIDFAIARLERESQQWRAKQRDLLLQQRDELGDVNEDRGAAARRSEIRRRIQERDRAYLREIRANDVSVRKLRQDQKTYKCAKP